MSPVVGQLSQGRQIFREQLFPHLQVTSCIRTPETISNIRNMVMWHVSDVYTTLIFNPLPVSHISLDFNRFNFNVQQNFPPLETNVIDMFRIVYLNSDDMHKPSGLRKHQIPDSSALHWDWDTWITYSGTPVCNRWWWWLHDFWIRSPAS